MLGSEQHAAIRHRRVCVANEQAACFDGSTVQMHNGTRAKNSARATIVGDPGPVLVCLARCRPAENFLPNFIYTKTLKDTAR